MVDVLVASRQGARGRESDHRNDSRDTFGQCHLKCRIDPTGIGAGEQQQEIRSREICSCGLGHLACSSSQSVRSIVDRSAIDETSPGRYITGVRSCHGSCDAPGLSVRCHLQQYAHEQHQRNESLRSHRHRLGQILDLQTHTGDDVRSVGMSRRRRIRRRVHDATNLPRSTAE